MRLFSLKSEYGKQPHHAAVVSHLVHSSARSSGLLSSMTDCQIDRKHGHNMYRMIYSRCLLANTLHTVGDLVSSQRSLEPLSAAMPRAQEQQVLGSVSRQGKQSPKCH